MDDDQQTTHSHTPTKNYLRDNAGTVRTHFKCELLQVVRKAHIVET